MGDSKSEAKRRRPTKRLDKSQLTVSWASAVPSAREELAVHPKKLEEIDNWMERNAVGRHLRPIPILLLTGPTGCGKTAALHVVAKEKRVEIQEWTNQLPDANTFGSDRDLWDREMPSTSQTAKFSEFLLRSNHYATLQFTGDPGQPAYRDKLVLLEDLPNCCLRDPQLLHVLLVRYRHSGRFPLVLVISDSSSKADSNARKVVPPKLCEELGIDTISMNPVANTLMVKALERIVIHEREVGNLSDVPGKSVLTDLAEKSRGDIRAALNSLHFSLMTKSGVDVDQTAAVKGKRKQTGGRRKPPQFDQREENLLLFSALGKILYSKRSPDKPEPNQIGVRLEDQHQFSLEMDPEDIVDKSHVDGLMFVMYLHENYLDFHTDIDLVDRCAEYLSLADSLNNDWRATMERNGRDSATSIAARAVAHFLDRTTATTAVGETKKKGGSWHPIRKPEWLAVWKKFEAGQCQTPGVPEVSHCDGGDHQTIDDPQIDTYDEW